MGLPQGREARSYYQAAKQRLDDARFLLEQQRTTGAIYLAGYSVECMLKALILATSSNRIRPKTLASFRGAKAHDYDWLKIRYFDNAGPDFPSHIARAFSLVNSWETELRYKPGSAKYGDAEAFLKAAEEIMTWADGRM